MNYQKDKFKISTDVKKFILDLEKLLANVPRKDLYNRDRIRDDVTDLLYLIHLANYTKDERVKRGYQIDILAKLSLIDFYLERAYTLKYISSKQLYTYTKKLEEITKMTHGWIKSEES